MAVVIGIVQDSVPELAQTKEVITGAVAVLKVAVTVLSESIVRGQVGLVPAPEQAPPHSTKTEPTLGLAVSVTPWPELYISE